MVDIFIAKITYNYSLNFRPSKHILFPTISWS